VLRISPQAHGIRGYRLPEMRVNEAVPPHGPRSGALLGCEEIIDEGAYRAARERDYAKALRDGTTTLYGRVVMAVAAGPNALLRLSR
jgi:hypothetical protein